MRLHRLTVEAFGPFPDEVVVDFDELGADGLFLIHGPTGAGKTSLLDAVCFALYGSVPGARRETRQALHSHHADPTRVPRVTLELTAAGRRLRIERQPEFARPKKRGTGTTRTPAKVVMTELVDGTWVDRGNGRHDDVAQIVDDVIGLGLAQFQTVVLLPQGDFASFLRADTTARAEVLARLFDTGRYDDIQAWLENRRRETEAAVRVEREELRLALARAADAAATVPGTAPTAVAVQDTLDLGDGATDAQAADPASGPLVDPEATDPDAVHAALTRTRAWLHSVVRAASTRATEAGASLAVARRAREQAEGIAQRRADAARAQAALDTLAAAQPAVDADRARLALAERAAGVAGHLAAVDAERAAHDNAHAVVEALPAELVDAQTAARRAEALAAHDDVVARLLDLANRRRAAARDLSTRAQALDTGHRDLARAEEAAQHAATQAEALAAQVTAAQEAAAHEPALDSLATRLDRLVAVHAGTDQARAALDRARTAHTNAQTAAAQAQRVAADLGRARADGLAAELALTLTDGTPCPVCGAHEHPAPAATADGTLISAEDVAAAEERLADAAAAATRAATVVAAAEARLEERSADLETHLATTRQALAALTTDADVAGLAVAAEGPLDPAHTERVLAATRTALTAARHQARRATELDDRRAELLAAAEDAATHGAQRREQLAALTAAHEAATATVTAVDDELRTAARTHDACPCHDRTDHDDHDDASPGADDLFTQLTTTDERDLAGTDIGPLVDALVVRHRQQVAAAAAALAAHAEASRRGDALDQARQRLRSALALADLDDEQAVRAALLTDVERASCTRRVQEHTERVLREKAVLQQEAVIAALHAPAPDLDLLTHAEHTHAEAARAATDALALARHAETAFTQAADAAGITLDRLGPALHAAAVVREVADTAAGTGPNNTLRMSLSTFVLAARLEEVVRLANERLAVMTGGRYELRHSDALAARGKRSGLGLEVLDAWSGIARDTKTLSGGETFMASLALALGLGDAVRAETGGLELETLFVDEGFGTLDEEALEQVMTVLDGLREGGRSVGIVSHVAELRTRIPSQLRLVRTQHGSRIETVTGLDSP